MVNNFLMTAAQVLWVAAIILALGYKLYVWIMKHLIRKKLDKLMDWGTFHRRPWK